ncbi:hypothetical protein [Neobacillus vireti]|uniref:Uncharacterized protein n=1 Tax=Neobacillus vireti LMG 21834 TaxID=1131730 RepID=A0AB94IRU4_9BACI|nr:hypothetical protein [Neobacillus vireti]ETI69820.1 hypothetical protein BAVI_05864 [Neobacillus vireti LMG 21834]KLT17831.1 hypothetical protein AA980_12105 [Neobacillus vireti]
MTQYIYLASPVKLPEGTYGLNPVSPEQPNVFETELDFAHLSFENNYDRESKSRFSYSPHFTFHYQVACSYNFLFLKEGLKGNATDEKCLGLLHSYISNALQASGIVEYYTSWNGEEALPITNRRSIQWTDIKTPYDLVLTDREF